MSESTTISAMLKSVSQGPAWHGPSVKEVLEGVTAADAARRRAPDAHTIWEILLHINAWQDYVVRVLDGKDGASLEGEVDWPRMPSGANEQTWEVAKRHYEGSEQEIRERLIHLDESKLHTTVPGRDFALKVLLHGIVHHNIYHLGQIALLKKL